MRQRKLPFLILVINFSKKTIIDIDSCLYFSVGTPLSI